MIGKEEEVNVLADDDEANFGHLDRKTETEEETKVEQEATQESLAQENPVQEEVSSEP